MTNEKKPLLATIKEHAKKVGADALAIAQGCVEDRERIDWLENSPDELENVRGRVNNEDGDGTVREAIDFFKKLRP